MKKSEIKKEMKNVNYAKILTDSLFVNENTSHNRTYNPTETGGLMLKKAFQLVPKNESFLEFYNKKQLLILAQAMRMFANVNFSNELTAEICK